jgi:ACDE family multidrug resistance protein
VRQVHLPVWLGTAGAPRARTFAVLYSLAATGRVLLITLIPLQALALLGDAQAVSVLYFAVSAANLALSLSIPRLVRYLQRRRVFTLGGLLMVAAPLAMALGTTPGLVAGMVLQVFGVACIEITLSLYLMDHIRRQDMGRFEPTRLFYAAGVWAVGPWLGVYLKDQAGDWVPYAISSVAALVTLCLFWVLRLQENSAVSPAKRPPPRLSKYLPRFFEQPRLRLAWLLAFGRSAWWAMFFVYAPIFAVESGLDQITAGAIVSIASGALFIVPLWGWLARRYGLRRLFFAAFAASGLVTVAIALSSGVPWLAAAVLVAAAITTSAVDGGGNVPFLRAVHPMERAEMTTVFTTYRDVSQLAPPGVFALLLKVFHLPAVFVAGGIGMLVVSYFARYLPRRM